jgi:aryl-alcohol dehydrogenase-like predicted oxidoreductase
MQFGWTADEPASFAVMDAYFEAGGNFLDTSDIYSNWAPGNPGGISEDIIGRWTRARGNRDRLVIATKVRGRMWEGPDGEGLGRTHIMRAVEDSLRRLNTEHIDLYQAHWPDDDVPVGETMEALEDLVRSGKVRHVGASNYSAGQLQEALRAGEGDRRARYATLQPHYNLVHRAEYEQELAAVCEGEGLGVIPYSPLAGGFLTGKYRRDGAVPEGARARMIMERAPDQAFDVVEAVEQMARAHGTTAAAVALSWLLTKSAVTAPIVGANSVEQLRDSLPASDLRLQPDEISLLDRLSAGL